MSTLSEREAILRRALHAAADGIEPGGDGLQRIQSRLGRPRPLRDGLGRGRRGRTCILRAPGGLQSASSSGWPTRRGSPGSASGPTSGDGRAAARPAPLSWLRPLAALGVTVFIVAAGAYVALDAQQAIFPSSASSANSPGGNTGSGGGAGGGSGNVEHAEPALRLAGLPVRRVVCVAATARAPSPRRLPLPWDSGAISPPSPTPSTSASQGGSDSPSAVRERQPIAEPDRDGDQRAVRRTHDVGKHAARPVGPARPARARARSRGSARRRAPRRPSRATLSAVVNPQTQASPPGSASEPVGQFTRARRVPPRSALARLEVTG